MALFAHFRSNDIILTQCPDPIESHQGKWSAWMAVVGTDHCVAIHTWWHESGQSAINHVHIGIADEIKSIQLLLITPEKIEKKPEITDSARIVVIYLDIQKIFEIGYHLPEAIRDERHGSIYRPLRFDLVGINKPMEIVFIDFTGLCPKFEIRR